MTVMQTSVIIPVYNAAEYVHEAVESAVAQPETAEVIVVEDGSQDNSLAVCEELAAKHPSVHLYRHPDEKNHGYPASTNLGILKGKCEYIAFLDADDFYLPGRFAEPAKLFERDPELEGVYEAIGGFAESDAAAQRWEEAGRSIRRLTTVTKEIPSEQLFTALLKGKVGSFSSNGLVVKRSLFDKTGLFDEHLRLHQDTAMTIKMAAVGKLSPGRLNKPVAMFRIHMHNRISAPRSQSEVYRMTLMCWETVWRWSKENLDEGRQQLIVDRLLRRATVLPRFDWRLPSWARFFRKRLQLALLMFSYPSLIWRLSYWKHFLPSPRYWGRRLWERIYRI